MTGSSKLASLQCLEHTKERDFFSVSTSLKNPPVKLVAYWCLSLADLTVARLCLACISHPCPSEAVSIIGRNKLGGKTGKSTSNSHYTNLIVIIRYYGDGFHLPFQELCHIMYKISQSSFLWILNKFTEAHFIISHKSDIAILSWANRKSVST